MSRASAGEMPKKALSNNSASARKPPCRARCPSTPPGRSCPEVLQRASGTGEMTSPAVFTTLSSWAVAATPPASEHTPGPQPTELAPTELSDAPAGRAACTAEPATSG
eukprot:scaffold138681_cov28-Tisochrysis_lutea.AAC.5